MSLQPHQERVVEEKKDLDEKIEKLDVFLNTPAGKAVAFAERERLGRQSSVMKEYSEILHERIIAFT